jgi:hypothetical protein
LAITWTNLMGDLGPTIDGAIENALLENLTVTARDRKLVNDAVLAWLAEMPLEDPVTYSLSPQAVERFKAGMMRLAQEFTVAVVDGKVRVEVPHDLRVIWYIFENGNQSLRGVGDATAWVLAKMQQGV